MRALRGDELNAAFSDAIRSAVARQLQAPFDDEAASRQLNALYDRFATPAALVQGVATAGCQSPGPAWGGDVPITINHG